MSSIPREATQSHNLLLFTGEKTKQAWEKSISMFEPAKLPTWQEDFNQWAANGYKRKKAESEFSRQYSLPDNFCCNCGDHEVAKDGVGGRSMTMFNDSHAHADIKRGEIACGIICKVCLAEIDNEIEQEKNAAEVIEFSGSLFQQKRADRVAASEAHVVSYIYSQRQKNIEGDILGDDTRREKYKDIE